MYDYYDEYPEINPEDFLYEYEIQIRELMKVAIQKGYGNLIKELEEKTQQVETTSKELENLRRESRTSKMKYDQDLKQALKDKEKEVERRLSIGFAVNDTVWRIKSESKYKVCDKCNGKYEMQIEVLGKKTRVNCPHCSYGNISSYTYSPKQDAVKHIKFYISRSDYNNKSSQAIINEDKNVTLFLDYHDYEIKPSELYKTLEECQKVCDEKNQVK